MRIFIKPKPLKQVFTGSKIESLVCERVGTHVAKPSKWLFDGGKKDNLVVIVRRDFFLELFNIEMGSGIWNHNLWVLCFCIFLLIYINNRIVSMQ